MAGRGVDRAGALFERDVIAEDAERIAIEKRMAEDGAFELRAGKRGDGFRIRSSRSFSAVTFSSSTRDDVDVAADFDRDVFELRMIGDGDVGRDGPGRGGPDEAVDLAAGERGIDGRRVATSARSAPRWTGWCDSRIRLRLRPARCGRACTS